MTAAKVLVVDDEPDFRDMVARELGEEGYGVSTAGDGLRAISCLEQTEFDVVITDVRMPGATGVDVLRAAHARAPDTEVVMTTGYASLDLAVECLRAGAFDFVQKPFNVVDLVATVARAVERRQERITGELYQSSQAILETRELERLPEIIVEVGRRVMAADDASLMLPDLEGRLYVAYSSSTMPEVRAAVTGADRVAGRIAREREPVLITHGLEGDPRFSDITDYKRVASSIVYPLWAANGLVGVLNLNRMDLRRPFRRGDVERAAVLASQALLALENSRLLRQMVATERLATIGQLSASVAHEINNPVSFVLTSHEYIRRRLARLERLADAIEQEPASSPSRAVFDQLGGRSMLADLNQASDDLSEGAGRIRDIVFDLRGLARTEDGPALIDLNAAIRSALRVAAAEVRTACHLSTHLGNGAVIIGSTGRLSQVFLNLLVNAAHAVRERGDGEGKIVVSTRREGDEVIAEVFNNGPAIPPGHVNRIFEPFFTTKNPSVGTGLGLSISREIVRRHHGDLRVESNPELGTRFTIVLPAAVADSPTGATTRAGGPGAK